MMKVLAFCVVIMSIFLKKKLEFSNLIPLFAPTSNQAVSVIVRKQTRFPMQLHHFATPMLLH